MCSSHQPSLVGTLKSLVEPSKTGKFQAPKQGQFQRRTGYFRGPPVAQRAECTPRAKGSVGVVNWARRQTKSLTPLPPIAEFRLRQIDFPTDPQGQTDQYFQISVIPALELRGREKQSAGALLSIEDG
jgi:hypothetical protein